MVPVVRPGGRATEMDRDEAMKLLKGGPEGVKEWNRRREAGEEIPNLSWANLFVADLSRADLSRAYLRGASLNGADLRGANLIWADLSEAYPIRADLPGVYLKGAILNEADLTGADLRKADLRGADVSRTNLIRAKLQGADLSVASCDSTIFADVDLSDVKGLDLVHHQSPSHLSTDTLIRSRGQIPEVFLRGCGVPDALIAYLPTILGAMQPIQFYSCFISYSSKDTPFAERLHADLQAKGVRCWYAPHDLKIGDRFRLRIDESIRVHDKLLLVLSEGSVASQEVENEVEAAMDREKAQGETVLFPIRLDDAVMRSPGWPALVRRTRHIGDFTRWKDHDAYQVAFDRLLRDLEAEVSAGKP
jgi:hypothetical protein